MNAKEYQLLNFLKSLGIEKISKKQKEEVFKLIDECGNLDLAKSRLEVLYQLNSVLVKSYSKISITNMLKINDSIDKELIIDLIMILYELKSQGASNDAIKEAFKESVADVIANNKTTSVRVRKVIKDEFDKVAEIKNVLYTGMMDENQAEKLFENCKKRSKHFLRECDAENLLQIIKCLKNTYSLSNEQIVGISTKCATLFSMSTSQKIQNIEMTINDFKNFILNSLKGNKDYKKGEILLTKNFQDILLETPSLFVGSVDFIQDSIRFLMGEKLANINTNIKGKVGEIKGDFTPLQIAKIYDHSITSLNVSPAKIGELAYYLNNAYYKCYGKELDFSTLINGRNFPSIIQVRQEDYMVGGKIETIFNILKEFISDKDMQNLLENNFSFLIAEIEEVKISLQKAILESNNQQELKANVLHSIKTHFGRYEGLNRDFEKNVTISVGGLKKVLISDVEEEQIVTILSKLQTTEDEIEKWKSKWNKEEREMRDLEIELELEALNQELDYVKELSKSVYGNIAKYEEENEIILSLLDEIVVRKDNLVSSSKFNKTNEKLLSNVTYKIAVIQNLINQNIDSAINYYNENIKELEKRLAEQKEERAKYDNVLQEYSYQVERLQELGISEESIQETKDEIQKIKITIEDIEKRTQEFARIERRVKSNIEKFATSLTKPEYYAYVEEQFAGSSAKRYTNNEYVYMLFAKILVKDGLFQPHDIDKIEEYPCGDKEMTYEEYRCLLPSSSRALADEIYNDLKNSLESNNTASEYLNKKLKEIGFDSELPNSLSKGMTILNNQMSKLSEKVTYDSARLANCNNRLKALSEIDVDKIDENIVMLEKAIGDFLSIIDKNNKLKIKI